ncbi:hypothetical protein SLEP1_g14488 [Rubroshorea leprosula]|uniref:Integrase catalytic domain-containing protein n=1 Tax=Rubroshorea leprosula TaxID=152421 RepID=A0AAV5IQ49_9ROSI|nr:hypothetical protein SLEP1_g14488 [Rubroshorea leprosula]
MAMGKILSRLIPNDPLIPLLNRSEQPTAVVATRNSPALSKVVVPTRPRGSGKLNLEPSSSRHNEELLKKKVDLEKPLKDVQKFIDELKSPRHTMAPEPDEHLHTYQAIMRIQNATDAMMCKVFPATLKSTARRWDYMQQFNKSTLDIDNISDTICLSALLHGLKLGQFLDDLLENPPKSWNEVNDRSASFILSEDFQFSKRRADDRQGGQSARGRKAYACQSNGDYKRADGEPDVMMPHADPFVTTVHTGNHNVNKVFIDTEPHFRMALVSFLIVKMESAFNAILGRATLCELKAVISQPHLCMKLPTPQGVGVLKGNQKMARACYQDTFKKVELVVAPKGSSEIHRPTQPGQHTLIISDIEHRPEGVEANQDVFAWTTDEMPGIPIELAVHKLSTDPTERLVVQKRCLFGLEKQAAIDEEIQKLLQAGFIRRVEYSEWVSNLVLVKKPNDKWRMCSDFINLNEACLKDPHPLPNVEKLVERAAGHERMSFLDANSGYHQVQLLLDDQEKTAFYASDAIYCYVMINIEVYVDDMIVTSKRADDHIDDLNETFQNLRRAQMKLNPLKCTFAVESGKFIGYVVCKKGIEVNPKKVQAIQQMEPPKTIKDVQRLTGRVAALHRFIARSVERCLPFFKALQEPKNFQWTAECQQAFDELKQYLVSAPLLSKLVEGESLYLYLGVTEEANYPLAEKAAFALVYMARKLRAYFQSHQIIVYTDLPLRKILQKPELSGRLIGWSVELKERAPIYPVWVLYVDGAANIEGSGVGAMLIDKIPRADNQQADELSKLASLQDINPQRSTIVEVLDASSYTDLTIECQLLSIDPSSLSWTTPLMEYLRNGELPEDPSTSKLIKRKAAHFTLIDNQLYKRAASMPLLCCLTPYEAENVVREVHEGVCGTHIGGKTLARKFLRHGYYWPTMVKDAQSCVKKCPTCQFNADDIHVPGVDLLGPFVKGKGGCTFLVVAVDYFTKWIEVKPLSMTTDKKIEEFLFNSILCRFGIPKRIIADNGPQFRAAALRLFYNDYGIELALTSVYTPQSNGQAESANKIILQGLKTGETPLSLAYGAEAVIPVEVGLPSVRSDRHNDPNNEQLLRENLDVMEEVREMSRIRNMVHQSRVAKFYNKRVRARQFQVGNLVLRKTWLTNSYSHMGKLALNWEGPYMVICVK